MVPDEVGAELLRVEVVFCPRPGQTEQLSLQLAAGSTLAHALHCSGLVASAPLRDAGWVVGIWGKVKPIDTPLRDLDRVEIYRPLQVDPKEARRLRYKRHKKLR